MHFIAPWVPMGSCKTASSYEEEAEHRLGSETKQCMLHISHLCSSVHEAQASQRPDTEDKGVLAVNVHVCQNILEAQAGTKS